MMAEKFAEGLAKEPTIELKFASGNYARLKANDETHFYRNIAKSIPDEFVIETLPDRGKDNHLEFTISRRN